MVIIKIFSGSSPGKRLGENIFLRALKHFSKPRKDRYIFLLTDYFVKIKNEHGNAHFNFLFQIFHADNVRPTFYIVAVTMQDSVILLHNNHHNIINMSID